jgi:DNA recombination protein RmuC
MAEFIAFATFVLALIAAAFAMLGFIFVRRAPVPLAKMDVSELLRFEGDAVRAATESSTRTLRLEIGQTLSQNHNTALDTILKLSKSLLDQVDSFGARLEASNKTTESRINEIGSKLNSDIEQMGQTANSNRETLRGLIEQKLDTSVAAHADAARELREELNAGFQRMRQGVSETLNEMSGHQKERLESTTQAIEELAKKQGQSGEQLRQTVEGRLDLLRGENTAELEKVRATVDEKLQTTLEARLNENFGRIVEQLNKAYEVFRRDAYYLHARRRPEERAYESQAARHVRRGSTGDAFARFSSSRSVCERCASKG